MSAPPRPARRRTAAPPPAPTPRRAVPRWAVAAGALGAAVIAGVLVMTLGRADRGSPPAASPPPPTAVVADIDGHRIPVREFALYLAQDRAATFSYFQQTYGAADGPRFWNASYGGRTPADYLRELALTDVTRATVILDLGRHTGLIPDAGYDAFLADWQAENIRRLKAVTAHQVIYGPVQYTETDYFSYILAEISAALPEELAASGTIRTSDTLLHAYYQAHLNSYRGQAGSAGAVAYPPYSQVASQVRQDYLHAQFQALIGRLAKSARIHIDSGVLGAVAVN